MHIVLLLGADPALPLRPPGRQAGRRPDDPPPHAADQPRPGGPLIIGAGDHRAKLSPQAADLRQPPPGPPQPAGGDRPLAIDSLVIKERLSAIGVLRQLVLMNF